MYTHAVDLVVIMNPPLTAWSWKGSSAASFLRRRKSFSRGILWVFAACIRSMKAIAIFFSPDSRFLSGKSVKECRSRDYIEVSKFDTCRFGAPYRGCRAVLATRGLLPAPVTCQGGHPHLPVPASRSEFPMSV